MEASKTNGGHTMSWKKADPTRTLHKADCARAFSHKDMSCPRCIELANGAAPRAGWNDAKIAREEQFSRELAAHDCKERKCNVVCTFGDW